MTDDLIPTTPQRALEEEPRTAASTVGVWLGSASPLRSTRWLDGACATAAKLGSAIAIAAGDREWLDVAAAHAARAQIACVGVETDLALDYLGWAQVVAAAARQLGTRTVLVDEASRPERFPEVAAVAELLELAQLTHVTQLTADGAVLDATRLSGRELQMLRVRGPAVIGLRIAGPPIDHTPAPSTAMQRLDLPSLGLDPVVLGHRALPHRVHRAPRKTFDKVADYLAAHVQPGKER